MHVGGDRPIFWPIYRAISPQNKACCIAVSVIVAQCCLYKLGTGGVEWRYYPPTLSVRSVRATFTAYGSRCSGCSCGCSRGNFRGQLEGFRFSSCCGLHRRGADVLSLR